MCRKEEGNFTRHEFVRVELDISICTRFDTASLTIFFFKPRALMVHLFPKYV